MSQFAQNIHNYARTFRRTIETCRFPISAFYEPKNHFTRAFFLILRRFFRVARYKFLVHGTIPLIVYATRFAIFNCLSVLCEARKKRYIHVEENENEMQTFESDCMQQKRVIFYASSSTEFINRTKKNEQEENHDFYFILQFFSLSRKFQIWSWKDCNTISSVHISEQQRYQSSVRCHLSKCNFRKYTFAFSFCRALWATSLRFTLFMPDNNLSHHLFYSRW